MFRPNQNQRSVFLIRAAGQAGLASGTDIARRNTSAKHPYLGKRPSDSTLCDRARSRVVGDPPAAIWATLVLSRTMSG